jgi:hypothetical protein
LYSFCLNAQSEEPIEVIETSDDITPFLPEKDFFIGNYKDKKVQTTDKSIPSASTEYNYDFNKTSQDYCAETSATQYQNNNNNK